VIGVTENLRRITESLADAARLAGRSPDSVCLLAVSKTKPVEAVLRLAEAGQRDFGENYVQEGIDKITAAGRDDLTWHFIGHLQSNKTRPVAEHFDWVHTIDRLKIARRLSEQRPETAGTLNVCIQVNVDDEAGKGGVQFEDVEALASRVRDLPNLKLRGLMCIPAIRTGIDAQRAPFARLRNVLETLNDSGFALDTLSMGMTADYRAAILEGATIVRIGTALFGARD
jgi:pyridoxal phosphate enzyme (YggS family)